MIGTVTNITFDNYEGNKSLGYVGSFRAHYWCRMCLMSREECQRATKDDPSKYRNRENYAEALRIIENSTNVDYKETKGIKFECAMNKLHYFHILDNYNVDLVHDLYEGVVRLFMQTVLDFLIAEKVFTFEEISAYVANFDYGKLNRQNIPSTLLDKKNIGQNASQIRCLLLHLPFVMLDFKDHPSVKKVWPGVSSLLTIIRIIHSADLYESDLNKLDETITFHLEFVQEFLEILLTPKYHTLLHYPPIMRFVGPVVHMSTMRYESKHKAFTDQAHHTNNFMNIGRYIALRHQQQCALTEMYQENVQIGKLKSIDELNFHSFEHIVAQYFGKLFDVKFTNWARVNSNYYAKGLFVVHEKCLYEIQNIFCKQKEIYLLCSQFVVEEFDSFLNSILIKKTASNVRKIIPQSELLSPKSYERKSDEEKIYIINDTMEIDRLIF